MSKAEVRRSGPPPPFQAAHSHMAIPAYESALEKEKEDEDTFMAKGALSFLCSL